MTAPVARVPGKRGPKPVPERRFDEAELAQVETLGAVLSLDQLADYFGMERTLLWKMRKRQPEIEQRYKLGKARAIDGVAGSLLGQARDGNLKAQIFYLKTQAGWRSTDVTPPDTTAQDLIALLKAVGGRLPD